MRNETRALSGPRASARDRGIVSHVAFWFAREARRLPWRTVVRDPYISLVSEVMLQQTQVARVLEKFGPFIERFPTVRALAGADEQDVLAMWSGLGYYRRARSLHGAARMIVERFGGAVPREVESLLELPGVGRYTAGAIASLVFGEPAPIVDGNVARVLMRVEGRPGALNEKASMEWAWGRSTALVRAAHVSEEVGGFNEGLMELGATVCTPAAPRCDACPLAELCVVRAQGLQERIPSPKSRSARKEVFHSCLVVRDAAGRTLVERRPARGLWAGMWQPVTLEEGEGPVQVGAIRKLARSLGVRSVRRRGGFSFQTTHRDVRFEVWEGSTLPSDRPTGHGRLWLDGAALAALPLSNAHRRILIGAGEGSATV